MGGATAAAAADGMATQEWTQILDLIFLLLVG